MSRTSRAALILIYVLALAGFGLLVSQAYQPGAPARDVPGRVDGATLLPNGWRVAPAGESVTLGNMPVGMMASPDGRYLVVSMSGYLEPGLAVVDTHKKNVEQRRALGNAWLGLAWNPTASTSMHRPRARIA